MIRLFDIKDGEIIPTEHCYAIDWLKTIMDNYPDNYLKIYKYIFYSCCYDEQLNPYFNIPDIDKEEIILRDINADFDTEDELIIMAKAKAAKLYETPTARVYQGMSKMMERLAKYMENTEITHGRDGNINSLIAAAKNYDAIRHSFKGVYKDLQEEQKTHVRGNAGLAYDQM